MNIEGMYLNNMYCQNNHEDTNTDAISAQNMQEDRPLLIAVIFLVVVLVVIGMNMKAGRKQKR